MPTLDTLIFSDEDFVTYLELKDIKCFNVYKQFVIEAMGKSNENDEDIKGFRQSLMDSPSKDHHAVARRKAILIDDIHEQVVGHAAEYIASITAKRDKLNKAIDYFEKTVASAILSNNESCTKEYIKMMEPGNVSMDKWCSSCITTILNRAVGFPTKNKQVVSKEFLKQVRAGLTCYCVDDFKNLSEEAMGCLLKYAVEYHLQGFSIYEGYYDKAPTGKITLLDSWVACLKSMDLVCQQFSQERILFSDRWSKQSKLVLVCIYYQADGIIEYLETVKEKGSVFKPTKKKTERPFQQPPSQNPHGASNIPPPHYTPGHHGSWGYGGASTSNPSGQRQYQYGQGDNIPNPNPYGPPNVPPPHYTPGYHGSWGYGEATTPNPSGQGQYGQGGNIPNANPYGSSTNIPPPHYTPGHHDSWGHGGTATPNPSGQDQYGQGGNIPNPNPYGSSNIPPPHYTPGHHGSWGYGGAPTPNPSAPTTENPRGPSNGNQPYPDSPIQPRSDVFGSYEMPEEEIDYSSE